jgi:hypothetical protein
VWHVFACDQHRDLIDDPRLLTEADRRELAWRREQHDLAMAGKLFERVTPIRA